MKNPVRFGGRPRTLSLLGTAAVMSACESAPTHFHSLAQIELTQGSSQKAVWTQCTAEGGTGESLIATNAVLLTHLRIPAEVNRMQISLHQTSTRFIVLETERWATPLSDQIQAVVINNLQYALPGLQVTDDPMIVGRGMPIQLQLDFEKFDARRGEKTMILMRWRLATADSSILDTGLCTSHQKLMDTDIDELVLAWSRSLSGMTTAMAASIRLHVSFNSQIP